MQKVSPFIVMSVPGPFVAQGPTSDVYRKEVVYPGHFVKRDQRGQVEFELPVDETLMDHWVATFQKMKQNGIEVPVPVEHTTDPEKRRGTVEDLKKEFNAERGTNSLYMYARFSDPKLGSSLAKTAQVSLFSPPDFYDGKGNKYVRPITHVALTDYPLVPGLGQFERAVAASRDKAIAASHILSMDTETEMGPMAQLAEDLGVDVAGETDEDAIRAMIVEHCGASAGMGDVEDPMLDSGVEDDILEEDPALDVEDEDAEIGMNDLPMDDLTEVGEEDLEPVAEDIDDTGSPSTMPELADALGVPYEEGDDDTAIAAAIVAAWDADDGSGEELAEEDEELAEGDAGDPMAFEPEEPVAPTEDPATMSMSRAVCAARKRELSQLARERRITPALRDQYVKKFADPKRVAIAMSRNGGDAYDDVMAAVTMSRSGTAFPAGERTGAQQAGNGGDSPLIRDAERRIKSRSN